MSQPAANAEQPTPPRGRPKGSKILDPARARLALQLQRQGLTYEEIGAQLNCGKTSVVDLLAIARKNEGNPVSKPQLYVLTRNGKAPLAFHGILRSEASSEFIQTVPDKPNKDVWTVRIFELSADPAKHMGYVVAIDYLKKVKGTHGEHHFAEPSTDLQATLAAYNPLDVLVGFPSGPRFEDKQRDLEAAVKRQFAELVSNVLKPFPETI